MAEVVQAGKFSIPVLYEDNHLLVVVKPPNLPSQADSSGDEDLLGILKGYIGKKYQKPGNVYLGLVHRLDRPVGGAMVFARTSKAAARLSKAFAAHAQDRRYLAVLQGELREERAMEDWLLKGADGMVRVVAPDTPGAKRALLTSRPARRSRRTHADRGRRLRPGARIRSACSTPTPASPSGATRATAAAGPGSRSRFGPTSWALSTPRGTKCSLFTAPPPDSGAWRDFQDVIKELV